MTGQRTASAPESRALPQRTGSPGARKRLLSGLPVDDRRLHLAGIPTAVLEGGDGPPLVMLHGTGELGALWMRVIPDLASRNRVVVPDLPGHGASGMPDGRLDVDRVLDWLDALIEQTCPSPPALVGHLVGGAVAARYVIARRGRVSRLVLVDSTGLAPFRPTLRFLLAMAGFIAWPNQRTQERLFRGCFTDLDRMRQEIGERWENLASYALDRATSADMKTAARALMTEFALKTIPPSELQGIAVPTTLVWGRDDLQVRVEIAEAASDRFGWPLHVIDGAGDDPAVERPAEFIAALQTALGTPAGAAG